MKSQKSEDVGRRKLEIGSQKSDVGSRVSELEVGSHMSEVGGQNSKVEVRTVHPQSFNIVEIAYQIFFPEE